MTHAQTEYRPQQSEKSLVFQYRYFRGARYEWGSLLLPLDKENCQDTDQGGGYSEVEGWSVVWSKDDVGFGEDVILDEHSNYQSSYTVPRRRSC